MTSAGLTIWLTGLSGAGKSTIAEHLSGHLKDQGLRVEILDGDLVREGLCAGLGFSKEDRDTNVRRIGFVADLLTRNGVVVIVAAISPYRAVRAEVRERIERFLEVYVRCPIQVLAQRDVKGLYRKALTGEIQHFTGISDPYEEPEEPDVVVDSSSESIEESVGAIQAAIHSRSLIPGLAHGDPLVAKHRPATVRPAFA